MVKATPCVTLVGAVIFKVLAAAGLTVIAGIKTATLPAADSVIHRFLSGPVTMPRDLAAAVASGYSLMTPKVVTWAIWLLPVCVTHNLLSGPLVIAVGRLSGVSNTNSVSAP